MAENSGLVRPPSISELSFNCPHCGALAKQYWFSARVESLRDDSNPFWMTEEDYQKLAKDIQDPDQKRNFLERSRKKGSKRPFLYMQRKDPYTFELGNVHVARCYNCKEVSIWFGEGIVWPARGSVARPNPDMPASGLADYEEAAEIVDSSPRGAAALLRLAIQKICIELGGSGKNINEDIAELVKRGLDPRVQQALDVVRVVGNNAVHPGEMDIRDDREVADNLFNLVNLIVDIMISQPKHVSSMFSKLPPGALDAIAKRDKR